MPKRMTVDKNPDAKGLMQVASFLDKDGKEVDAKSPKAVRVVVLYYRDGVLVRRGMFERAKDE